jgi:hypothetical protein
MKKPRRGFPSGAHFVSFNFPNTSIRVIRASPAAPKRDTLWALPQLDFRPNGSGRPQRFMYFHSVLNLTDDKGTSTID